METESTAEAVAEGMNIVEGAQALVKRVDYATVHDFIKCVVVTIKKAFKDLEIVSL